ncbi:MAG TPA: cytoplasmic protein [bacterium]|nr:cytoplasmic protein [bacterium]HPQ65611.1 cytoplasmic protein [bacterium]
MEETKPSSIDEITIDPDGFYREEIYSDLKLATVRKMVPVKADGSEDPSREAIFIAETNVMSAAGPLPLTARLEATDLTGASAAFPGAIKKAMDRMVEEINELRRRESSRIVVPGETSGLGPASGAHGMGSIKLT